MNATEWLLLGAFLALVAWDFYAYWHLAPGSTISLSIYERSRQYPLIPFVLGIIVGHILWPH